jgi:hypothetical protein
MLDTSKIYTSVNYGDLIVTNYTDRKNVEVEFINSGYKTTTTAWQITAGQVKDYLSPSVCGVGFMGAGRYKAKIKGKLTRPYQTWISMMKRCYNIKTQARHPTYIGCTVCTEWHNFQNFANWHKCNYIDGFHLDKDTLICGNKEYSPTACCFISQGENTISASAKHYKFKDKRGIIIDVYNLNEFCAKNQLTPSSMGKVHLGLRRTHKGWIKG